MSVGGSLRWEDEEEVGFLAGPADADGAVRRLDGNEPICDKARTYADFLVNHNPKFFTNRVNGRLLPNVRIFLPVMLQPGSPPPGIEVERVALNALRRSRSEPAA